MEKVTAAMRRAGARAIRKQWTTPKNICLDRDPALDFPDEAEEIYRAMRAAAARERTRKKR